MLEGAVQLHQVFPNFTKLADTTDQLGVDALISEGLALTQIANVVLEEGILADVLLHGVVVRVVR